MDSLLIKKIVEAALMVAGQPLTLGQMLALFPEGEQPPKDAIREAITSINEDCEQRGIEISEVASGFRFQVKQEIFPHLQRMWEEKPQRYSRALLETLALIAYRQPITRGEIEEVRGVSVSTNIIRALEERDWIRVIGHRDVPGKPALFGTTKEFLDYFNLSSLDQLPTLAELRDIDELEPELDLGGQDSDTPADSESDAETTAPKANEEGRSENLTEAQASAAVEAGEQDQDRDEVETQAAEHKLDAEATIENEQEDSSSEASEPSVSHDAAPEDESSPSRDDLFPHIDPHLDVFSDDANTDDDEEEDPELALDLDAILAEVDEVLDHTAASQNITIEETHSPEDDSDQIAYTEAEDEEAVTAEQTRAALQSPEAQLDLAVNASDADPASDTGGQASHPPTDDDVSEVH
ncbi:MAG: SMC-Scp complex subunit ScpB [Xanthomonadales bacterium]|nr:SMC-Scp complex subunit ScpB [Xanthomonadales bacterium]